MAIYNYCEYNHMALVLVRHIWRSILDAENTMTTEDQTPVTVENIKYIIELSQKDKLPFIVAVKGNGKWYLKQNMQHFDTTLRFIG